MPDYSKKIVYLSQSQYQELITNESITVDGVTITYNDNDIYVTPQAEPVTDVRVNGTSVTENGVANIPIASSSTVGVVKTQSTYGTEIYETSKIGLAIATAGSYKEGYLPYVAVTIGNQEKATFYGLSKAAGVDLKNDSNTTLQTGYPDSSKAAIQSMLGVSQLFAPSETDPFTSAHAIGELFTMNGKLYRAKTAVAAADAVDIGVNCEEASVAGNFPHDVQVDGNSVVSNGIATIPAATTSSFGVVKPHTNSFEFYSGFLRTKAASNSDIKEGGNTWKTVTPGNSAAVAFYGLAAAATDTTQSASSNAVGTYTPSAKNAIHTMLGTADLIEVGFVENVSGSAVSITGQANYRYNCTESSVTTLSITPPSAGSIDVYFTSGSSATVLTVPNTVKWPAWFDATALEPNTLYEILITDGVYGSVMTWAT